MSFHYPMKMIPPSKCTTEGCARMAVSRGLCEGCYSTAIRAVKKGHVTWVELINAGLVRPRPKGSSSMTRAIDNLLTRLKRNGRVIDGATEEVAKESADLVQILSKRRDPLSLLNKKQISSLLGIHPRTITRLVGRQNFPPPVRIGSRRVGWRCMDIEAWAERSKQEQVVVLDKKKVRA